MFTLVFPHEGFRFCRRNTMNRLAGLLRPLSFLVVLVVVVVLLLWVRRGPERTTRAIWEDAIDRADLDRQPDIIGIHSRREVVLPACDWWALQTVSLQDVALDHAEILAISYERDGWDVTRLVRDSSNGNLIVFAILPDRSQRVRATFDAIPGGGVSITAAHDPGNCPLARIDDLNFDFERTPIVDSFD